MIETLYAILMHGSDADIDGMIYRASDMSPDATRISAGIVSHHLRTTDESASLTLIDSVVSGEFTLFVLGRSWTDGETPLIVHTPTATIAGIMMPFNDLSPLLAGTESASIADLSAQWIVRKVRPK